MIKANENQIPSNTSIHKEQHVGEHQLLMQKM